MFKNWVNKIAVFLEDVGAQLLPHPDEHEKRQNSQTRPSRSSSITSQRTASRKPSLTNFEKALQQSNPANWRDLSNYLFLYILQYVDTPSRSHVSSLSRRFMELSTAHHREFWGSVSFSTNQRYTAAFGQPEFAPLTQLKEQRKRIEYLDLSYCRVEVREFFEFLEVSGMHLKSLDLSHLHLVDESGEETDELNGEVMDKIFACCQSLTSLSFASFSRMHDYSFEALPPTLRKLNLINYHYFSLDALLMQLGLKCPNLIDLSITPSPSFSNDGLHMLARGCPKLRYVVFESSSEEDQPSFDASGIISLIQNCPFLTSLTLCHSLPKADMDAVLRALSTHGKSLRNLNVASTQASDDGMLPFLQKCGAHLKCLNLRKCLNMSSSVICMMAQHCAQLEELVLPPCRLPAFSGVMKTLKRLLVHGNGWPELFNLEIASNEPLELGGMLCQIAQRSFRLKSVKLEMCVDLYDDDLTTLSQCRALQHLSLNRCHEVGDQGIITIAQHCRGLQVLEIIGGSAASLTDSAVLSLAENCAMLRVLELPDCYQISTLARQHLVQKCTALRPDCKQRLLGYDSDMTPGGPLEESYETPDLDQSQEHDVSYEQNFEAYEPVENNEDLELP
eukprot:TRINITY_DN10439_c0_g1_i6.p1 TRINITY_DN10439_c0_g1~~TRINITY_DN10439_c0_g1_i6.p1  ORF type:complete len:619 (+),score=109.59 TRINITY_DN10439_c0_g1_i6:92-1948(+)